MMADFHSSNFQSILTVYRTFSEFETETLFEIGENAVSDLEDSLIDDLNFLTLTVISGAPNSSFGDKCEYLIRCFRLLKLSTAWKHAGIASKESWSEKLPLFIALFGACLRELLFNERLALKDFTWTLN
jgi:hypothetical protein